MRRPGLSLRLFKLRPSPTEGLIDVERPSSSCRCLGVMQHPPRALPGATADNGHVDRAWDARTLRRVEILVPLASETEKKRRKKGITPPGRQRGLSSMLSLSFLPTAQLTRVRVALLYFARGTYSPVKRDVISPRVFTDYYFCGSLGRRCARLGRSTSPRPL